MSKKRGIRDFRMNNDIRGCVAAALGPLEALIIDSSSTSHSGFSSFKETLFKVESSAGNKGKSFHTIPSVLPASSKLENILAFSKTFRLSVSFQYY
jgi:hypothetical protein